MGFASTTATGCCRAPSASRAPATTRWTRCARTATPSRSPARRGPSATPIAAPARGQPRPERDHDRDGAARRAPAAGLLGSQRRAPGGRADGGGRPGDADPRGPGAADEHHPGGGGGPPGADGHPGPADSGDRGAGRGRHDLRRQDRDAHRRHPRPGLGRGGGQDPAGGGPRGPGPLRALGRGAESDPPDDRRALPGQAGARRRRGALLLGVEVERRHPRRAGIDPQLRDGGARRARPGGGARADPQARAHARGAHGRRAARGRLRGGVGDPARRPWQPASAAARAARPGGAGGAASPRRRGDDRVHAQPAGGPEADLRRRPADGHRGRARGRRSGRRRRDRGARAARRPGRDRSRRGAKHDLLPDHARSRRRRWSGRSPTAGASRR